MQKALAQRILENLNTTVVLADAELCVVAINPAAEMLFEISSRQAAGRPLTELLSRNQSLIEAAHQSLVSGHPFTEHGLRLAVPGNRRIAVDCTVTPLARGDARPELLIELIPIDRLLRLAHDENLQDQHVANRAVMRGLAHEIKNPLGGLRGAAQLLERELGDRGLKEYTRIIIHEADRLRNLVDRMAGPDTPPDLQPTNIHQVFEHVRSLILAEYPVGIILRRDYDPSLPEFMADPGQLVQAILNIARNAAQAINGQGVICLRTRVERNLTMGQKRYRLVLRAEIEDNGLGIPEELRAHIFFPMVTGRPEGTGLGLSIARSIIHQHHGVIECVSRPQQTIFRIYLPLEYGHD